MTGKFENYGIFFEMCLIDLAVKSGISKAGITKIKMQSVVL